MASLSRLNRDAWRAVLCFAQLRDERLAGLAPAEMRLMHDELTAQLLHIHALARFRKTWFSEPRWHPCQIEHLQVRLPVLGGQRNRVPRVDRLAHLAGAYLARRAALEERP